MASIGWAHADRVGELNAEGVKLFQAGEYQRALGKFQKALELEPGAPEIRGNIGKSYTAIAVKMIEAARGSGERRIYRRALENIELALMYWKGDEDTVHAQAICHFRLGQLESAQRSLELAVKRYPRSHRAWRLLGVVRERRQDVAGALDAFRAYLKLKPSDGVERRVRRLEYDQRAVAEFRVLRSTRFEIYYPTAVAKETAEQLQRTLREVAAELERRWTVKAPRKAVVICYPPGEFAEGTGLHGEVGGAFDGRIRIAFPAELAEGGLELVQVARHEAVHLYLRALEDPAPRWVDEGLAQYIDGDPRKEWEPLMEKLVREAPHLGIEDHESRYREDEPDTWAPLYVHAFFFLRHLGATHKDFRIDMWVREVVRGKSWRDAFASVFGDTPDEVDKRWRRESLKMRASPRR